MANKNKPSIHLGEKHAFKGYKLIVNQGEKTKLLHISKAVFETLKAFGLSREG